MIPSIAKPLQQQIIDKTENLPTITIGNRTGSEELEDYYIPESKEYFFDRNRSAFEPILYYYQSNGIMCLPSYINPGGS